METSNPFRKHLASGTVDGTASHSSASVDFHPTASPAQRPKPSPPAVTPRKRASRIVESSPSETASSLQLARLVDPPVHFDQEVPAVPSIDPDDFLPNPFMQGSDSSAGDRTGRSSPLDLSEFTTHAGEQADRKYTSGDRPRYSLDPEAFKHLMLTGELLAPGNAPSPPRALSAQTTTSHVAIKLEKSSEPVSSAKEETKAASGYVLRDTADCGELDVLRRSLDAGSNGQTDGTAEGMLGSTSVNASPSISRSSSTRVRPPPPKPRTRSGGKQSISIPTSLDLSTPPSPPTNRPNTRTEDKPLPRLPPPPPPPPTLVVGTPAPTPRISDQEKKKPPPPPLSRRHSVQVRSSTPVPERGASSLHPPPPPPPPVRRTKSAATRNSRSPGNGRSILPPLPPLPPGVSAPKSGGGSDSPRDAALEGHLPVLGEEKEECTGDILVDLEKLQREVDELRGKLAVGV